MITFMSACSGSDRPCLLYIVLYNSIMAKAVNISTARRDLPSLFDKVTGRKGEIVVIRRRDGDRQAVLVDREHFESLEAATRRLSAGRGFKLIGSGEATGDIDAVLSEIRADDRREAERRQAEMSLRARRLGTP
jgi:PHD/YefM family antitoxin component YafN of YafNO toxin-antitoxin module